MASLWTDLIGVIINPDGTDEELDDIIFELLVNEENQDEQEQEENFEFLLLGMVWRTANYDSKIFFLKRRSPFFQIFLEKRLWRTANDSNCTNGT